MSILADPQILEIFLYSNNYKDRILIAEMKERAQIISIPQISLNSFFVQADEVEEILQTKFRKDVNNFQSTPYNEVGPSVTSIYFIDSILNTFKNLKYFKVNVSDSTVYSRKIDNRVNFDFKIVHSRFDLANYLNDGDLSDIRNILSSANILKIEPFVKKPFIEIQSRDFIHLLSIYGSKFEPESETNQLITGLKTLLGPKMESDNPTLLIILEK